MTIQPFPYSVEQVLSATPDAVVVFTLEGRISYCNYAAERMFNRSRAQMLGVTIEDLGIQPAQKAQFESVREAVISKGVSVARETFRVETARFYEYTMSPLLDESGRIQGIVTITRDIDGRKRTADDLAHSTSVERAAREHFYALLMQAPVPVVVYRGPDHVYDLVNPLGSSFLNHRDVIGKPIRDALPELEAQGTISILDEVYRTGKPYVARDPLARVGVVDSPAGARRDEKKVASLRIADVHETADRRHN